MALKLSADRRQFTRYACPSDFTLHLKVKGSFKRHVGVPVDFNRHGMAFFSDRSHAPGTRLVLDLVCAGKRLSNLICVVHNCMQTGNGYRCGVGFRPQTTSQREAESYLSDLEKDIIAWEASSA
jgi:hypothetical protein